jgi:hypothetical protein
MTRRRWFSAAARRRLARRLSATAGSIVPGVVLVWLPKCPMCLAVWLTAATGIGVSSTAAAWARGMLVVVWMAAVALVVRRRAFACSLSRSADCGCHREKLRTVRQGTRAA